MKSTLLSFLLPPAWCHSRFALGFESGNHAEFHILLPPSVRRSQDSGDVDMAGKQVNTNQHQCFNWAERFFLCLLIVEHQRLQLAYSTIIKVVYGQAGRG